MTPRGRFRCADRRSRSGDKRPHSAWGGRHRVTNLARLGQGATELPHLAPLGRGAAEPLNPAPLGQGVTE